MKAKAVLGRRRISQKTNKQICFVCHEKQNRKQNKFVHSFFGESTACQSAFGFTWPVAEYLKMWFWIDTLGSNLNETLIFNWNVIQFGALWAGNLLRHFLMIVELSVIPTNDSLIIRLNYLNLSFTLFLSSTVVSWIATLNSAKSC